MKCQKWNSSLLCSHSFSVRVFFVQQIIYRNNPFHRQNLECYQETILSLLPLHYMPLLQNNINYSLTTTTVVTYCLTHLGQLQFSPSPLRNFLYIYNCTIITRDKLFIQYLPYCALTKNTNFRLYHNCFNFRVKIEASQASIFSRWSQILGFVLFEDEKTYSEVQYSVTVLRRIIFISRITGVQG